MSGDTLSAEVELVRRRASDLAGPLSRTARLSASLSRERAILRLIGVDGLDRDDRPLAAAVAARYCGAAPERLAAGLLLPFAVAAVEYDMSPRDLALDVASGTIDLGLEAELLARPDKLEAARRRAAGLLGAAMSRIDANRTAAREMRSVLGRPPEPQLGIILAASEVTPAVSEIRAAVGGGAGIIEIRVPAASELAQARSRAGLAAPDRFAGSSRGRRRRGWGSGGRASPPADDPIPAGSQRGLAMLRGITDDAAAARGRYVALVTVTSALAAPEQAVVAAFERIDCVEADPVREIVEENIDPDRALADHAFAHRLLVRSGSAVLIGPGPLVLGADVASGLPSDADTRAGRALALQVLGLELALADRIPAEALLLGTVPTWVAAEGDPMAIMVGAWLRRAVFAGHRLAVTIAPAAAGPVAPAAAIATALAGAAASLVFEQVESAGVAAAAAELRAVSAAAAAARTGLGDGSLWGSAAVRGRRILAAAADTLDRLAGDGWESLLGPDAGGPAGERFGRSAVVAQSYGPAASGPLIDELL